MKSLLEDIKLVTNTPGWISEAVALEENKAKYGASYYRSVGDLLDIDADGNIPLTESLDEDVLTLTEDTKTEDIIEWLKS